jgi:dienelactone hydrolase
MLHRKFVARRRLGVLAITLLALVAITGGAASYLLRDPLQHFVERHAKLAKVVEGSPSIEGNFTLTPVRLTSSSGLAVDLVVRRAIADTGLQLPGAIILGGPYKGHEAIRMLGDTRGAVVAAMSYPFSGNPRPNAATFLRQIPAIRAAFLDTPPAIQLAVDYLTRLPEVDPNRVEAVGVSLGAPFVCMAGALDTRISRVWAVHGSGGSYEPLEANMRRSIPFAPLRKLAALTANIIIAGPRLDPAQWVGRIAPRPFVMVNARDDERLPRSSVDALYSAAAEPKEMIWMSGAHVHGDSATIRRISEIVVPRVRGSDLKAVAPSQTRRSVSLARH